MTQHSRRSPKDGVSAGDLADYSPAEVEEAFRALARKGLVKDSGRRRDGQIVWVAVEFNTDTLQ